ncbi:MAG TPA: peptidylprolyl isomerase [Vicinamibacterales bacterium]
MKLLLSALALGVAALAGPTQAGSGDVLVRIETPLGNIDVAVDPVHAPLTAANFLRYVDAKLYDGGRFHRATRPDDYVPQPERPPMQIVQAGINPVRRSEGFPPVPLERTTATGLKHVSGVISMARTSAADSATSDFFICLDDEPALDFGSKRYEDGQGFAAFGRVTAGMDVVRRIQQQPVNTQADTAAGRQSLMPPVAIARIARIQADSKGARQP